MKRRDFLKTTSMVASVAAMSGIASLETVPAAFAAIDAGNGQKWYRGALHTHTVWSDGDALPEVVVSMFKEFGYDFVALTDHNTFANYERWREVNPQIQAAIDQAKKRGDPIFGDVREVKTTVDGKEETKQELRLATFDELSKQYDKAGEFLLIPSEELSRSGKSTDGRGTSIHANIFNITKPIPRAEGTLPTEEGIREEVRRLQQVGVDENRLVAVQLNHPTWVWFDNRAEEIAAVDEVTLLEPYNLTTTTNRLGTKEHESADRIWDIVTTLRLASGRKPVFATATDDCHNYRDFGGGACPPGRGWVMVRATELTTESLLTALLAGDFYASSGVTLKTCEFDPQTKKLTIEIDPKSDTTYTIEFIGTKKDCPLDYEDVPAPNKDGTPGRPNRKYNAGVGQVLQKVEGTKAEYTVTDEWYIRAHIVSDRTMTSAPTGECTVEEAWTQPVF